MVVTGNYTLRHNNTMPTRSNKPRGTARKRSKPDEGEWRFYVGSDQTKGKVTIKFARPVSFLAFLPDDARSLARDLIEEAKRLEQRKVQ